jgi:antirestriction protein ArdC
MKSTSLDNSAATRVASFEMVVKIASSMLCSTLPHQFGFFLNTVFTPAWCSVITKGPVPLVWSAA